MSGVVRLQKQVAQPIHSLFRFLQQVRAVSEALFSRAMQRSFVVDKVRVEIWLYEQTHTRIEGVILGFDEYMNIVLDSVEEVSKSKRGGALKRKPLGRLLLKGDNICAVCQAGVAPAGSASSAAVDSRAASAAADVLPAAAAEAAQVSSSSAAGAESGVADGEGEAGAPSSKRPRRGNA